MLSQPSNHLTVQEHALLGQPEPRSGGQEDGPSEVVGLGADPDGEEATRMRSAGLLAPGAGLALTERGMFLHGEVVARLG